MFENSKFIYLFYILIFFNNNLCQNCFKTGHLANYCKGSRYTKCNKPHNVLLHEVKTNKSYDNHKKVSTNTCTSINNSNKSLKKICHFDKC